jgi:hypothetical protein
MECIMIVAIEPNVLSTLHAIMPDLMGFAVRQWKGSTWPAVMNHWLYLPIVLTIQYVQVLVLMANAVLHRMESN